MRGVNKMLIQFRFENFKSFRDDNILDLSATGQSEYPHHIINIGKEKLLPVAAVYGNNASGKSNLISAFRYMTEYVIDSFSYGDVNSERQIERAPELTQFLLDKECVNKSTLFEVYFIGDESEDFKTFNYGFSLNKESVIEEWLNIKSKSVNKSKPIFYRNKNVIEMPRLPKKSQDMIKTAINPETLIISLGAKLKIKQMESVRNWFFKNCFNDFGRPLENLILSSMVRKDFAHNKSEQQKVISYLSTFDSAIKDFKVELIKEDEKEDKYLKIDAVHKNTDNSEILIPLSEESSGTQKMFALYPWIYNVLNEGSVLFIDELSARLHPLLVRNIIITFLDPEKNPKHAQLIFATHDPWLLSCDLLRRDEIWFASKDDKGVSEIYSLAQVEHEDGSKVRKDENYQKNYLQGIYGAIPDLSPIKLINIENKDVE